EDDFKADSEFVSKFAGLIQTIASFTGGNLPLSERELFILFCQIRINSFVITDHHGADLALGIFLEAARLDHSCKPNVEYLFSGKYILCLALENITHRSEAAKNLARHGTEDTKSRGLRSVYGIRCKARISYIDPMSTTSGRNEALQKRYFFKCNCSMCLDEDRDRRISGLLCCGSDSLNEPTQVISSSSSNKERTIESASSDIARCCPSCNTRYNNDLIEQLSHFLTSITEESPTIELGKLHLLVFSVS
ncbi:unnamed protein product, partial [Echinostoma caproni]|uniref:SET domain-containing protein n=1 Tax=Echinostoma caproni TaxID=27848 RepID=A0A183BAQ9_9TREM